MEYLSGTDATDRRRPLSKVEAIRTQRRHRATDEGRSRGWTWFRTGRDPRLSHVTFGFDPSTLHASLS